MKKWTVWSNRWSFLIRYVITSGLWKLLSSCSSTRKISLKRRSRNRLSPSVFPSTQVMNWSVAEYTADRDGVLFVFTQVQTRMKKVLRISRWNSKVWTSVAIKKKSTRTSHVPPIPVTFSLFSMPSRMWWLRTIWRTVVSSNIVWISANHPGSLRFSPRHLLSLKSFVRSSSVFKRNTRAVSSRCAGYHAHRFPFSIDSI